MMKPTFEQLTGTCDCPWLGALLNEAWLKSLPRRTAHQVFCLVAVQHGYSLRAIGRALKQDTPAVQHILNAAHDSFEHTTGFKNLVLKTLANTGVSGIGQK